MAFEKDRIIKDDFGKTLMGRDLLAQDYILKQITASLIYPEDNLGKKFWNKVYTKAQQQYGTTNIPVNTFNKVWILPDDALIYEKGNTAYVLKNHLKVMLEEDYLSLKKHSGIDGVIASEAKQSQQNMSFPNASVGNPDMRTHTIGSQIIRELVLPALEKEVNEGQNFAMLRQVYSGMLLAAWFKRTLKQSILGQIYADKAKLVGIVIPAKAGIQKMDVNGIYQRYLQAYKKGVFNYIKEDADKYTNETIPRKYFSGGAKAYLDFAQTVHFVSRPMGDSAMAEDEKSDDDAQVVLDKALAPKDAAMTGEKEGQEAKKEDKAMNIVEKAMIDIGYSPKWLDDHIYTVDEKKTPREIITNDFRLVGLIRRLGTLLDQGKEYQHLFLSHRVGDAPENPKNISIARLIVQSGRFDWNNLKAYPVWFQVTRR